MSKIVPLEGFGGGGSSPLNFKIVAYATEEELAATQPKENTIGVVTTTPITEYYLQVNEPTELSNGILWMKEDTSSEVFLDISAKEKNNIYIYLQAAYQYSNDAWVRCDAYVYTNAEWISLKKIIYSYGVDYGGGWSKVSTTSQSSNYSFSDKGTYLQFYSAFVGGSSFANGGVMNKTAIDLSAYNTLELTYTCSKSGTDVPVYMGIGTSRGSFSTKVTLSASSAYKKAVLDISSISGEWYVGVYADSGSANGSSTVNIYEFCAY